MLRQEPLEGGSRISWLSKEAALEAIYGPVLPSFAHLDGAENHRAVSFGHTKCRRGLTNIYPGLLDRLLNFAGLFSMRHTGRSKGR